MKGCKKQHLPTKFVHNATTFSMEKKWERDWENVKYCSKKCQNQKVTALVWYRNDLRTLDHLGLKKAVDSGHRVIAYYTFNPDHYHTHRWGFKKTDRFRAQFLIESVQSS